MLLILVVPGFVGGCVMKKVVDVVVVGGVGVGVVVVVIEGLVVAVIPFNWCC